MITDTNNIKKQDLLKIEDTKISSKKDINKLIEVTKVNKTENTNTQENNTNNFQFNNKLELSSGISENLNKIKFIDKYLKQVKEEGMGTLNNKDINEINNILKNDTNNISNEKDLISSLEKEKTNIIDKQQEQFNGLKKDTEKTTPTEMQSNDINSISGSLVYSQANIQPFMVKHLLQ